ncbi:uncharacterized protein TNCT_427761 [Trichonephila clavata]|uniref:C2H2-type domain-containing protein n=1 Tax=Trichonephila clavata TaxID=2740835 RepID=A0A8X6I7E6_TRICU|nr:uncharacterized protein TNCT_427761 [Trichonephila clavata]
MELSLKNPSMDKDRVLNGPVVANSSMNEESSSVLSANKMPNICKDVARRCLQIFAMKEYRDEETTDSSRQIDSNSKVNDNLQEEIGAKNKRLSKAGLSIEDIFSKVKPPENHKNSTVKTEFKSQTKKICFLFRIQDFHATEISKGETLFKCHICRGMYKQKFSLKRHFLRNHIGAEYISTADLSNCKINAPNGEEVKLPVQEESKMLSGRKRFRTDNEVFLESNKNRHMPGLYKCHRCPGIRFDLETELKIHYDRHSNFNRDLQNKPSTSKHEARGVYYCKRCSLSFDVEADYTGHLLSHPNGKRCKYCEKEFSTTANRKRHEQIHVRGRGFSCNQCKAKFSRSKELDKHVKKMHGKLNIMCPYCPKHLAPKVLSSRYRLEMHVREKHKEVAVDDVTKSGRGRKPSDAVCCFCKKRFPSVKIMVQHKNAVHKKEMGLHKSKLTTPRENDVKVVEGEKDSVSNPSNVQLEKKRTTYVRKAKQATQKKPLKDKSKKKEAEEKERLERIESNRFYGSLSENIADNLMNCVDGKKDQIKLANYEFKDSGEPFDIEKCAVPWSEYNFPYDYNPERDLNRREKPRQEDFDTDVMLAAGLEKKDTLTESAPLREGHRPSYVCKVCTQTYLVESDLKDHFINNHPNVEISCIEASYSPSEIPLELQQPFLSNSDGILIRCAVPPPPKELEISCSKCSATFKVLQELYVHILDCGDSEESGKKKRYPVKRRIVKHRSDEKQTSGIRNVFKYGYVKRKYGKDYFVQTSKRGRRSQLSFCHKSGTCKYCNSKFASEARLNDHFQTCPKRFKKRKPIRKCKKVMQRKSPNFSPSSQNSSSENGTNPDISVSSSNQVMSTNIIVTTAEVHSENMPQRIATSSLESLPNLSEPCKSVIPIEQLDRTPIDALKDLVRDAAAGISALIAKEKGNSEMCPRTNIPKIKEVVKEMQLIRKTPANSNLKKNSALVFVASGNEESAVEKISVTEPNRVSKGESTENNRKRKKSIPVKIVLKKPAETQINSAENVGFTLEESSKQAVVVTDICGSAEELSERTTAIDSATNDIGVKQGKFSADLFLPEEATRNISNSEDRDSPTLELLVSSVTQNIENFDKPTLLDDDKFALPPPSLKSTVLTSNDSNEMDSTANSLNFKVIMPNVESAPLADQEMTISGLAPLEKQTIPASPTAENTSQHDIPISDATHKSTSENGISLTNLFDNNVTSNHLLQTSKIPTQIINILPENEQDLKTASSESSVKISIASNSMPFVIFRGKIPLVKQSSFGVEEENVSADGSNESMTFKEIKQSPKISYIVACSTKGTSGTTLEKPEKFLCEQTDAEISSMKKIKKKSESLNSVESGESQDFFSNDSVASAMDDGASKKGKRKSKLSLNKMAEESCPIKVSVETESPSQRSNDDIARQESDSLDKNTKLRSFRMKKSESSVQILSDGISNCSNIDENLINKPCSSSVEDSNEGKEITVKKEIKDPEVKNRRCPYCYLEFAYLTNFRRHIKKCPSKSENVADENVVLQAASSSQLQHLPNKDEVAQSMLYLRRHQLRQIQMIKEFDKNVKGGESSDLNFKKFSCEICYRIFFSLIEYMKHVMRHNVAPGMIASSDECGEGSSAKANESGHSSHFMEDSELAEQDTKEKSTSEDTSTSGVEDVGKKDMKTIGNEGCSSNSDKLLNATSAKNPSTLNSRNVVAPNKYKEPLDSSILELPSYGKGRGRKKKCVSENSEKPLASSAGESSGRKLEEIISPATSDAVNDLNTCVKENLVTKLRKNLSKRILSGGNLKNSPVKKAADLKKENESNLEQRNETLLSTLPIETEVSKVLDVSEKNDNHRDTIIEMTAQGISLQSTVVSKRGRKKSVTVPKQLKSLKGRKRKFTTDSQNTVDELTIKVEIEEDSKTVRFKSSSNQGDSLDIPGAKKVLPGKGVFGSTSATKSPRCSKNSIPLISIESSLKGNSSSSKTKGAKSLPAVFSDKKSSVSSLDKNNKDPVNLSDFKNVGKKKKFNKICAICKKKYPAALLLQRHIQLVHSRRNKRTESPVSPKEEEKKTAESPKAGRPSFQRQCSKPLPPLKRPYKKSVDRLLKKKKTL